MLSMENYFEFPSESESDDEDFVPTVGPENDETPANDDDATPDALNMSAAYAGPVTRSSPMRSSPNKGKKQASAAADTGYSSAAEMGPIDSNEWEWLMDQMKSIENGTFLPPLPPQMYAHQQQDTGNASEADADAESGSSPLKDGDLNSPGENTNVGGFYTSWPTAGNATTATAIFAPLARHQVQQAPNPALAKSAPAETPAGEADVQGGEEELLPTIEIVRKRGVNGKFTKTGKKGKNKPIRQEVYVHEVKGKKTAASQFVREDSVFSIADSEIVENGGEKEPPTDPYTTILPRKRGRAKNAPLSPRAEAAQAELRRARHLEQCEDYRERKKMKAENFERKCQILEEANSMLEDENKLLRKQVETLKEERERDRRALVQAGKDARSGRRRTGRSAATAAAGTSETDDEDVQQNKENGRLPAAAAAGRSSGSSGKDPFSGLSMEDVGKFVTMFMGMQKAQQAFPSQPMQSIQPYSQPGYQSLQYSDPLQDQAYTTMQQSHQQMNQQLGQQQLGAIDYGDHAAAQAMLGMFGNLQQQQQQQK